jgi:hypothetical protein
VHHRLAKILCAGLAPAVAQNDLVSGAIVPDSIGIVNRDIVGPLIELAHRISARVHDIGDEPIRFVDCTFGIVDELPLNKSPLLHISFSLGRRKAAEFKMGDALFPFGEHGFSALRVSMLMYDAIVFRTGNCSEAFMFETRNVIAEIFSIAGAIRQQCTSNLVFGRSEEED